MNQYNFKGTFIPVGGAESKVKETIKSVNFKTEGILAHVLKESGGKKSRILVIPTASAIPEEVGEGYLHGFKELGATNVEVLDIRSRRDANERSTLKKLQEANCVYFSGGNQSKIADKIGKTFFHELLVHKLKTEDFVLAGTSAGAMAMSSHMIAGGSASESLVKGAVKMKQGLAVLPSLIIDTHFVRRGRFGRLAEAVAGFPDCLGLGIGENTGLIIRPNQTATVIGSGMVIVMDPSELEHNSHALLYPNVPMSLTNLKMHILANGDKIRLFDKKIEVLPIEAKFL